MITNNIKHSIWNLIFCSLTCIPSFIGLFVGINEKKIWLSLGYLLFAVGSLVMLVIAIMSVQWTNIYNDKIAVRNIFGIIKEIEYIDIKKAFKTNVTIFSLKTLRINEIYLVLSSYKSLQKSKIDYEYNRKKHKYIILPFSNDIEKMIKLKYKSLTGVDLEIK